MAVSIAVPNLGREMAGGVVAEWYAPDGAAVAAGDLVCRMECDFVAVEIEAETRGLLRHRCQAGSIEGPGAVIAVLLAPGEAMPDAAALEAAAADAPVAEEEQAPPATTHDTAAAPSPEASSAPAEATESEPAPAPPLAPGEPIVVPFRRRPLAEQATAGWTPAAPGEAPCFETTEPLDEAGASIPGLPLWEPDEDAQDAEVLPEAEDTEPTFGVSAPATGSSAAAAATEATSAPAGEPAMEATIASAEVTRATRVLAREWRELASPPLVEDLVLRAFARALAEAGMEASPAGLAIVAGTPAGPLAIVDAAGRAFRDAVRARTAGGDATAEQATWVLTSLRGLNLRSAQPALPAGHSLAVALTGMDEAGDINVTIVYDSARIAPGEAARLLERVRMLVEEPYGLLS